MSAARPPRPSTCLQTAGEALGAPVEAAEGLLPADLIHDDEIIILLLRPSPLFIVLGALPSLAALGLLTMALAYAARLAPWIGWTDTTAFTLGGALVAARLGWQGLDWWGRIYVLTDRRLIRKMGVARVAVFETALAHIQHTSVFTRLRERLFGLGTIGFATAGSDVYEAFWVMIPRPFQVHRIVVEAIDRYGRRGRGGGGAIDD